LAGFAHLRDALFLSRLLTVAVAPARCGAQMAKAWLAG
jgi:hypothetical protein